MDVKYVRNSTFFHPKTVRNFKHCHPWLMDSGNLPE